jgi:23S rRNA pseudouridine1911/1915/1917 synthase
MLPRFGLTSRAKIVFHQKRCVPQTPEQNVSPVNVTTITIAAESLAPYAHTRIDAALARVTGYSRTWIQKQIRAGRLATAGGVTIENCRDLPPPNADLILSLPLAPAMSLTSQPLPSAILSESAFLYEDADVIVLNKPPGLVVHPAAGHYTHTLTHLLAARYGVEGLSTHGGKERAGIVHRLDRDTSGLMVIARNDRAHERIAAQFAERKVKKHYLALVAGRLRSPSGTCSKNIGRHPMHRKKMAVVVQGGRAARTDYVLIRQGAVAALLRCILHTGRTHQIRVHLAHLGHPILGDALYGGRRAMAMLSQPVRRQMLHAAYLAFEHPTTRALMVFNAPPPEDFCELAKELGVGEEVGKM